MGFCLLHDKKWMLEDKGFSCVVNGYNIVTIDDSGKNEYVCIVAYEKDAEHIVKIHNDGLKNELV